MAERIYTLGDLREEAGGVVTIESQEADDDGRDIREYDALIWTAHHRPNRDKALPLEALGPDWKRLQDFYSTPEGAAFKDIGDILGDVGATEISRSIFDDISNAYGLKPLWVYPTLGGRVGVDWNRKSGMQASDIPNLPADIAALHAEMHKTGIGVLNQIMRGMGGNAKLILQPHTMASTSDFGPTADAVIARGKALDGNSASYRADITALVPDYLELYNHGSNSSEQVRPDVDIITAYPDGKTIPDGGFSDNLERRFQKIGVRPERNKPFPMAPGYPGSELVEDAQKKRASLGLEPIASGLFDVAKRLIQKDGQFDALDVVVDQAKVQKIAHAVSQAVGDTI